MIWVWVAIDALVVAASVVESAVSASRISRKAKLPMHLGPRGFDTYVSRNAALVSWPASVWLVAFVTLVVHVFDRQGGQIAAPIGTAAVIFIYVLQRAAMKRVRVAT